MNKAKKTAAIIGIILILSMYIISFISALFATEYTNGLFLASVFCTLVIPIMIHLFLIMYKHVQQRRENTNGTFQEEDNSDLDMK